MANKQLLHIDQIDGDSLESKFKLNLRTQKTINYVFPLVQDGVLGPLCKFPYDGYIVNVDAYTNTAGVDDTQIDIEKISEIEFNANVDTWESILGTKVTIPGNIKRHDGAYSFTTNRVNKGDLFRIKFLATGTAPAPDQIDQRIRDLTIQITIQI